MGRKIIETPRENDGFRGLAGSVFAESEARVDLSIGKKIIEISQGNARFRRSVGLSHSAGPQNLSLV